MLKIIKLGALICALFYCNSGFSQEFDKVYLQNKEVVKGTILGVTSDHIEIDPEGSKPFIKIDRGQAIMIIYKDNTVVKLSEPNYSNENTDNPINNESNLASTALSSEASSIMEKPEKEEPNDNLSYSTGSYTLTGTSTKSILFLKRLSEKHDKIYLGLFSNSKETLNRIKDLVGVLDNQGYNKIDLFITDELKDFGNVPDGEFLIYFYKGDPFFTSVEKEEYNQLSKEEREKGFYSSHDVQLFKELIYAYELQLNQESSKEVINEKILQIIPYYTDWRKFRWLESGGN